MPFVLFEVAPTAVPFSHRLTLFGSVNFRVRHKGPIPEPRTFIDMQIRHIKAR